VAQLLNVSMELGLQDKMEVLRENPVQMPLRLSQSPTWTCLGSKPCLC